MGKLTRKQSIDEIEGQERLAEVVVPNDLYDGWMDRQFEKLQMAYCVTCKCFVDTQFNEDDKEKHTGHVLAYTTGEKASEEVIARLSE